MGKNVSRNGYGRIWHRWAKGPFGAKNTAFHRVVYEFFRGPVPHALVLRHRCHRRKCANPSHLIPGTHAENTADIPQENRHHLFVRRRVEVGGDFALDD